ncbi:MAG: NAD(P)-dependent oxidoreductase [Alphaproteobacteria bacterium]|nr:NAD(P)-dependent oxidoreductase [Alphaproteobacteria bacterium]
MKIGFIGLGTMGGSFATNIIKAGFDITVNDIHRQVAEPQLAAGAKWANTPRELAVASDVILTSLPGPREVEAVALDQTDGLIAGMAPGSILFDLSTNSPTTIRNIHDVMAEKGLHCFDAPVSGGPKGAISGKLAIWVGGDEAIFNANRATLDALGDQVRYIGPIGAGAVAKLVHNAAGYAIQTALAEVFSMGVKAGVEPLALWEAVRQGARGRQRTFDSLADHYLINQYEPADFALKLAHKDVSLAAEVGREFGVPMRLINATVADMTEALGRGWGDRDSRSAMILQQERAGIEFALASADVEAVLDGDKS